MKTLETNDWLVMNSIIYKIYTTGDFDAMRTQFLEQIKTVIDFDSADFYLASSNEKENLERPVFLNCDEDLSDIYENMDYSRGIKLYRFVFIVLVGAGSFLTLDLIWILADIVNGLMTFPNLVALIGLRKEIISETKDYFERLKATQHDQDELA